MLIFAQGDRWQKILAVKEVTIGMKGLAGFNIANALAAAAALSSLGVPLPLIKKGLKTFGLEKTHNPGRCQFYHIGDRKVILDYGHNAAAFRNVLSVAKKIKGRRVLGVIGVPGDRRDEDIRHAGSVAGQYLDYCIVKEDRDLRGRTPGETAALLVDGLKEKGFAGNRVEIILNEIQAVVRALSKSKPGDVVVVFYEELAPLQRLLEELEKMQNKKVGPEEDLHHMVETFKIVK